MDAKHFQNKRKQEQDEFYKERPYLKENYDWTPVVAGGIIVGCFAVLFLLGMISANISENNKNDCEQIGGKYEVVDEEFNGKVVVDVYGCVK